MKKVLLAILLMIITTTSLFALSSFYMAPYGASMVNLDAPGDWQTTREVDEPPQGSNGNVFPDNQLLIIGGMEELNPVNDSGWLPTTDGSELDTYGVVVDFYSPSFEDGYFWFTKQSDPEFRRPFLIQPVGRVNKDGGFGSDNMYSNFYNEGNQIQVRLTASNNSSFFNLIGDLIESIIAAIFSGTSIDEIEWVRYNVAYEFGIILPGEINNGILTLDDGPTYPIASGTDYSAEIEVTATLVDMSDGNALRPIEGYPPISFKLAIGGYYDPRYPDGTGTENFDTSASLYVTPYARAANINIRDDQGQGQIPIASVDFAIYDLPKTWTEGSAFIFLSASSNPFVQDTRGFRFVHESVGFGDAELPTNSIGYKITAVSDSAGGTSVTFDGSDYLTVNGDYPKNKIMTDHNDMTLGSLFGGGTAHWHSWNGELMLTLDTNNRMMNEGLYRSTVYVHVVTDDSLDQGGTA